MALLLAMRADIRLRLILEPSTSSVTPPRVFGASDGKHREVESSYWSPQRGHSNWYTTDDLDAKGRRSLKWKKLPILRLLARIILNVIDVKYLTSTEFSSIFICSDLGLKKWREKKLIWSRELRSICSGLFSKCLAKNFLIWESTVPKL